jgi:biotin transport system substrate-specific component
VGPTGGYLIAFPIAAALAGFLAERGWTLGFWRSLAVMMAGHVVILALGVAVLAVHLGVERAVAFGLMPFLVGTVLKSALGAALVTVARRRH